MKTITIPFNLEKAKAGVKVMTCEGYEVTIHSFNCGDRLYPIVGEIHVGLGIHPNVHRLWSNDGHAAPTTFCEDSDADDNLIIEEEVENKSHRMSHFELSKWLTEGGEHFRQCIDKDLDTVYTEWLYNLEVEDKAVENVMIREDKGEWEEPLITED